MTTEMPKWVQEVDERLGFGVNDGSAARVLDRFWVNLRCPLERDIQVRLRLNRLSQTQGSKVFESTGITRGRSEFVKRDVGFERNFRRGEECHARRGHAVRL